MKCIRLLIFMLLVSVPVFSADTSLEFRGVVVGGGPTKLSLVDKTTDTTGWVEVGKTFAGYTIKAYDATIETATLAKDGKEFQLRLNTSQVLEAPASTSSAAALAGTGRISAEIARMILNNLRQIAAAADQYYLETGKTTTTLEELVGPTKYIKQLKSEAGEDYGTLTLSSLTNDEFFSVTTRPSGDTITWDPTGKNSTTFYTVRAGETLAQIAETNGSSVPQIIALNGIANPSTLKVGQILRTK